ncbi:hypothetical protein ACFY2R_22770 [Micromonospora olivasterospora]|uniref:Uncharacterized protein n=1 Tax=Micromonospora olivasterospora TaxID=1880 RepID=A0A562ID56_MICOL|nr:hypothetical protein [Micromonospora olivasterospora]TWH68910.1 hypothetical protein JD77_03911 [Micromonospora olivasterospora]
MLGAGALLALGGATAPLTGCDLLDRDGDPPPAPDPLEPLAAEARDLAARHRAAAAANPDLAELLTPIAEAHEAHAGELAKLTGRSGASAAPSAAATPGGRAAVLAALREAEQSARETAAKLCAEAPAGRAAVLGSIAAARATHVEALK